MDIKVGFRCNKCNDVVYNRECFCGDLEVHNKGHKYIVFTDDPDIETFNIYVDDTGKIVKIVNNYLNKIGKDINISDDLFERIYGVKLE